MSTITGSRIDQVLHDAVDTGAVPNVVAVAADARGPIYEGAAGPRVAGGSDPVTADTTFRIASMTKMVATTAALRLVEQVLDRVVVGGAAGRRVPDLHGEVAAGAGLGLDAPAGADGVRSVGLDGEVGRRDGGVGAGVAVVVAAGDQEGKRERCRAMHRPQCYTDACPARWSSRPTI